MAQNPFTTLSERIGTTGHTPRRGNRSSSTPVNSQDIEPSIGEWGYDSTSNAPSAEFTPCGSFPNSAFSHHFLRRSDQGQAREQMMCYPPNYTGPFTNRNLQWERGAVETQSATWKSPADTTHLRTLSPITYHLSSVDSHSPAYPIWPPAISWTGHTTTGMPEEPLEAFLGRHCLDYWP